MTQSSKRKKSSRSRTARDKPRSTRFEKLKKDFDNHLRTMRAWSEFVRREFADQSKRNVEFASKFKEIHKDYDRLYGRYRHLLSMYTELKLKYESLYFENEELFHNQKLLERIENKKAQ
jgi:hypothetical protein